MTVERIIGDEEENKGDVIGIVVAKWNSFITDKLLEGSLQVLQNKGYSDDQIKVVQCPGAYEIPLTAKKLLKKTDGVIALGAVIRGDTPHFDYVCEAVNNGVLQLNMETGKPVSFGVLTTDNVKQASERAGENESSGNKGAEAALALLEMLSVIRKIEKI
ncbi:MAG: 6,7-dimethyl-8-ribityllumazine synthase [Candidatus Halalkalibacterium sp. M3_1C_030]